jgi:hypothetical protein
MYNDGVTPGNMIRPDKGRHFEALYWTLLEYPSWFRTRIGAAGWVGFSYVLAVDMKKAGVTLASLNRQALNVFWGRDAFNFDRTGMRIMVDSAMFHFRLVFACFLADDLGHAGIVSGKGASGTKPCIVCSNCVGRVLPEDVVDGLVHVTSADMSLFERHTPDSYAIMAETLRTMSVDATNPKVFAQTQQIFGLKFDPEALPWDTHLRMVAELPNCIYWDWQHNGVGSGGIGQYELNQFLRAIKRAGISLADVDAFSRSLTFPRGEPKLRGDFFQTRVRDKPGSHIRAFASEVLTATTVVGLFSDQILKPMGVLENHTACFDVWRTIVDILRMDEGALQHLPLLERSMAQHAVLF